MTNASLFAYVADGRNGLRVLQLTAPNRTEGLWGFSPPPEPELIATFRTKGEAIDISKGLDRDRAVDESGNQLAVSDGVVRAPFIWMKCSVSIYTTAVFTPSPTSHRAGRREEHDDHKLFLPSVVAWAVPPALRRFNCFHTCFHLAMGPGDPCHNHGERSAGRAVLHAATALPVTTSSPAEPVRPSSRKAPDFPAARRCWWPARQ